MTFANDITKSNMEFEFKTLIFVLFFLFLFNLSFTGIFIGLVTGLYCGTKYDFKIAFTYLNIDEILCSVYDYMFEKYLTYRSLVINTQRSQ